MGLPINLNTLVHLIVVGSLGIAVTIQTRSRIIGTLTTIEGLRLTAGVISIIPSGMHQVPGVQLHDIRKVPPLHLQHTTEMLLASRKVVILSGR